MSVRGQDERLSLAMEVVWAAQAVDAAVDPEVQDRTAGRLLSALSELRTALSKFEEKFGVRRSG